MIVVDQKQATCEIISLMTKKAMSVCTIRNKQSVELESKERILQSYNLCNKQFIHALFHVTKN